MHAPLRRILPSAAIVCASVAVHAADVRLEFRNARSALLQEHPSAAFYETNGWITRIYGTTLASGTSAVATAQSFVQSHGAVLGVTAQELVAGNLQNGLKTQPVLYQPETDDYRFSLVYYHQTRDGIPVFESDLRLLVREEPGYPLVLAASTVRPLADYHVDPKIVASPNFDAAKAAALREQPDLLNFTNPELFIWAGTADELSASRLAIRFEADNGRQDTADLSLREFVADAENGVILLNRDLIVHADVNGTVSAVATPGFAADSCAVEVSTPMPYARIENGGTVVYADANGAYTLPTPGTDPVTLTSAIRGRYFNVSNYAAANSVLTPTATPGITADVLQNAANSSEYSRAEVNAYIQANRVRDFALATNPAYPTITSDLDFPVHVSLNATCNAQYITTAIEFFRSGGGCANSAYAPVVHHEYGHHLIRVGGSGQGQYGEGMADCMSLLLSDNPMLGLGFQGNCSAGIRTAQNTFTYPCSDATYGIHGCGQLISGCVWNTRQQMVAAAVPNWHDILSRLTLNSIMLHAGTTITPQITIDFLTLDDDNAELTDGTPHYAQIAPAFGAHAMPAPAVAPVRFTYPNGLPTAISPAGGTTVRVRVEPVAAVPTPGTQVMQLNTGSGFAAQALTQVSANEFEATFPPAACGMTVAYYFTIDTSLGIAVSHPSNSPALAISAFSSANAFNDNFETDQGWTVQSSAGMSRSTGIWERGVPAGGGTRGDPATDFDHSGSCYLTGNFSGNSDVDSGTTNLISPTINLAGQDAIVHYARWFSNNFGSGPNEDIFTVSIANAVGGPFTTVETVGPTGASGGWVVHEFRVSDFITPTDQVSVRFTAQDLGTASVVEAAVDDFAVRTFACTQVLHGDLNCDGLVNNFDIDAFVARLVDPTGYHTAYPNCPDGNGDMDNSGDVTNFDIDPFVNCIVSGNC